MEQNQISKEQFIIQNLLNENSRLKTELLSLEYEYRVLNQEKQSLEQKLNETTEIENKDE